MVESKRACLSHHVPAVDAALVFLAIAESEAIDERSGARSHSRLPIHSRDTRRRLCPRSYSRRTRATTPGAHRRSRHRALVYALFTRTAYTRDATRRYYIAAFSVHTDTQLAATRRAGTPPPPPPRAGERERGPPSMSRIRTDTRISARSSSLSLSVGYRQHRRARRDATRRGARGTLSISRIIRAGQSCQRATESSAEPRPSV